ncbi:MAG TPA: hypothetical protein VF026_15940 [Ktedonobacteraceae bacterium]
MICRILFPIGGTISCLDYALISCSIRSNLNALPRQQVLAALDAHLAALQSKLEVWNSGEATQAVEIPQEMQAFVRLSFANGREHMEVDLRFLRTLRERLPELPPFSTSLPSFEEEQEE